MISAKPGDFAPLVVASTRRTGLLSSLLAALPHGLSGGRAQAAKINPSETQVTLPDEIKWTAWTGVPPRSGEMATLFGGLKQPGPYVVLMKWYPGYVSAPHSYATDRLCLVLSGEQRCRFRPERYRSGTGRRLGRTT